MAFQLPTFNIQVNIWSFQVDQPTTSPRVADAPGNLAWGKRVSSMSTGGTGNAGVIVQTMTLLLPKTIDIRGNQATTFGDWVEAPAGSGRFYRCWVADFIGYGFDNMHKGALLYQADNFKTPDV